MSGVAVWARRLHGAVRPHGSLASDVYSKECLALRNGWQRRAAGYLQAVKGAGVLVSSDSIDLGRAGRLFLAYAVHIRWQTASIRGHNCDQHLWREAECLRRTSPYQ